MLEKGFVAPFEGSAGDQRGFHGRGGVSAHPGAQERRVGDPPACRWGGNEIDGIEA